MLTTVQNGHGTEVRKGDVTVGTYFESEGYYVGMTGKSGIVVLHPRREGVEGFFRIISDDRMSPRAEAHLQRLHGYATFTGKREFDQGMWDTLVHFAESLGFPLTSRAPRDHRAKQGFLCGEITFVPKGIWINETLSSFRRLGALAHEVAHLFTRPFTDLLGFNETYVEMVTEAIACAILDDYGFDISEFTRAYIMQHDTHPHGALAFAKGMLDRYICASYTMYSDKLTAFLNDGRDKDGDK